MKLRDLLNQLQTLVVRHPEALELNVYTVNQEDIVVDVKEAQFVDTTMPVPGTFLWNMRENAN